MQPLNTVLPIAFLATIAALPHATAQDYYVEGTVGLSSFNFDSTFQEEYTMLGVRVGKNFTPNLAIEGEYAIGVSDEERTLRGFDSISDQSLTLESSENLNSAYGVFAKAILPMTSRLTAHARVGYATSEFETEGTVTFEDGTTETRGFKDIDPGIAYGLGTEFSFTDKLYARADATRYHAFNDHIESYTLGVGLRF